MGRPICQVSSLAMASRWLAKMSQNVVSIFARSATLMSRSSTYAMGTVRVASISSVSTAPRSIGLTAMIYAEVPDDGTELNVDETYILMPCADFTMRPIRMRAFRRLTLSEYRMGHLTAIKLVGKVNEAGEVMREIGCQILGDEVIQEAQARLAENGGEA